VEKGPPHGRHLATREEAETVNARLGAWLKERGLSMNTEKTRTVRSDDGFDFLSFNIRRHRPKTGAKALTRPSRDALHKIRRRIADELRAMRGHSPAEVIAKMSPIIRGQASYFRTGASKTSFQALDNHLWQHLYKWARRHSWPSPGNAPCATSKGYARCANNRCCTPTARPTPPASGKPGTRPSTRR
jgi:RNA-directed DNA polymerase